MITTKNEALAAVEAANWDADGSALSGAAIWGTNGQFASPRAASNYTYQSAVAAVESHDWA